MVRLSAEPQCKLSTTPHDPQSVVLRITAPQFLLLGRPDGEIRCIRYLGKRLWATASSKPLRKLIDSGAE